MVTREAELSSDGAVYVPVKLSLNILMPITLRARTVVQEEN